MLLLNCSLQVFHIFLLVMFVFCYTEIDLLLPLNTSVCHLIQITIQSRVTAQKPNLAVCVQAPLAVTCDQFVFDDLGKLLQYHYSYCIILLFLRMFERYSPASIKCIAADVLQLKQLQICLACTLQLLDTAWWRKTQQKGMELLP